MLAVDIYPIVIQAEELFGKHWFKKKFDGKNPHEIRLLEGEIKMVYVFACLCGLHQPRMAIDHLKCD